MKKNYIQPKTILNRLAPCYDLMRPKPGGGSGEILSKERDEWNEPEDDGKLLW
jgi:hypothetical protein